MVSKPRREWLSFLLVLKWSVSNLHFGGTGVACLDGKLLDQFLFLFSRNRHRVSFMNIAKKGEGFQSLAASWLRGLGRDLDPGVRCRDVVQQGIQGDLRLKGRLMADLGPFGKGVG